MKNRILFISLAVVLILSLSLVGCTTVTPPPIAGTLQIGGSFGLTGAYPEDCQAVLAAYQDYAKYVNDNHKMSPWSSDTFPSGVNLTVKYMDDQGTSASLALTNYETLKDGGLLTQRMSGSAIAKAMFNTLITDSVGATTQASGPYLLTPRSGTIFMNYPIYTDQCAAIADWFMAGWNATHPGVKPRVAYLTDNTFGQTLLTPEMDAYLTKIGYDVVKPVQTVISTTSPINANTQLTWCKDNNINLTLGAMTNVCSQPMMTQADALGIGWNLAYNMTIGLCSPSHLVVFVRDMGTAGNGLVVAGSYPSWTSTAQGVAFCKSLQTTYRGSFNITHVMYQHGLVEAMIQVNALRLAMLNTGKQPSELTSADVLNQGFFKITALDTGGIIPTTISYGAGDVEGAESVVIHQALNGVQVELGTRPLRHVY